MGRYQYTQDIRIVSCPKYIHIITICKFKCLCNFFGDYFRTVNVTLPRSTRNNGSLYVHAFLAPKFQTSQTAAHIFSSPYSSYAFAPLTSYLVPEAATFQLLSSNHKNVKNESMKTNSRIPITHWRQKLNIGVMDDIVAIPGKQVPAEIMKYLK